MTAFCGEVWEFVDGQKRLVGITRTNRVYLFHHQVDCWDACPLHAPSRHGMDHLPLHYRADRGIFERVCEHGCGHPDPDTLAWIEKTRGREQREVEELHGCDGCCS